MKRFELDAEQTDAILELKIYRLARLEILVIQQELADKRKRAKEIGALLKSKVDRWKIIRDEIELVQKTYGDARRSEIVGAVDEEEYTADDFIVEEDNVVVVTRDGWVKRQKEVKDIASTRVREGDAVLAVLPGSTRASVVFFTNFGTAYTTRIADVPASTGYGEPIQSLFKFKDGEKVVGGARVSIRRPRRRHYVEESRDAAAGARAGGDERRLQPAILARGRSSSRARAPGGGSRAWPRARRSSASRASPAPRSSSPPRVRRAPCCARRTRSTSSAARAAASSSSSCRRRTTACSASSRPPAIAICMTVETTRGAEQTISTAKYDVTGRGGKGRELLQRGQFTRVVPQTPEVPQQ